MSLENKNLENKISEFNEYLDKIYALDCGASLLYWDNMTGGSKGGLRTRIKAMTILSSESFEMSVSEKMKDFIDTLEEHKSELDEITQAKLRICKKTYYDKINIPAEEAKAFDEHLALANEAWEQAKNNNDFSLFAPYLEKNIEYTKRFVKYRNPDETQTYNILLDDYEPDMTIEKLDKFFEKLRLRIVPLLKKVLKNKKEIRRDFLQYHVPLEAQRKISNILAEMIGYDFNRGMLRETEHPFSMSLSKYDSRITTHYHENAFSSSIFSVLHESGHSIYEQNKMDEIAETLLDDGISMAIHESQSRFYENIIGRSREFWEYAWDKIKGYCGTQFSDVTAEQFFEAANMAVTSLIRIEADELTYSLHVMVRYELEKMIFSEDVTNVHDLPKLWNKKYEEYLGITPPSDSEGILQDVHWSGGMFGYFPSYALGSAYASQLFSYMQRDLNVSELIKNGEINKITDWLKEKIHKYGSIYKPSDLFFKIAGEDLNADYYIDYLEKKYASLYGFENDVD